MRRFRLKTLLFAAAVVLAACDPHEFPVSETGDALRDFSLKIQFEDLLPDHKVIDAPTKAGGVPEPRYTVLLFRYQGESAYGQAPDYAYSFTRNSLADLDTTIFLPIDPAKYRVAGWVDWVDDAPYYDLSDPGRFVFPEDYAAGEYARDAFAFTADYDVSEFIVAGEMFSKTVTMRRPVAQLRFVAPEALTFLSDMKMNADDMRATLKYTAPIPDGYDLQGDITWSTRSDVSLTDTPRMATSGELVFISDFLFSTDEGTTVSVEFTLTDATGKQLAAFAGDVPLRRAHATTVTFTSISSIQGEKAGGIGISPGFDDEIEVPIE